MRKLCVTVLISLLICLSGCDIVSDGVAYPYIEYRNSSYNFDIHNRTIELQDGYIIDEGHTYDMEETDKGYDLVLHFIKEKVQ